jgi:hypothetical protein
MIRAFPERRFRGVSQNDTAIFDNGIERIAGTKPHFLANKIGNYNLAFPG